MKKFTKVLENANSRKFYKTSATIELLIEAENEGEAGYLSDSILSSIEESTDYTIIEIEESEKLKESNDVDVETKEDEILKEWNDRFGDKEPTKTEKMDWYHEMREKGYDGISIFKVLDNKL